MLDFLVYYLVGGCVAFALGWGLGSLVSRAVIARRLRRRERRELADLQNHLDALKAATETLMGGARKRYVPREQKECSKCNGVIRSPELADWEPELCEGCAL